MILQYFCLLCVQDFIGILRRGQFDYIVDAANVAYNRQNFVGGKFSFKQVRVIYYVM